MPIIIDDNTLFPQAELDANGLIPRDYAAHPLGETFPTMEAIDMKTYPEDEWIDRIREKDKNRSWLWDHIQRGNYGKPIPNNYQNGYGYCWAYSTGHAVTAIRAMQGLPFVRLSPWAVGYLIKNGRNEGAWGALSCEYVMKNGIPEDEIAPNLKKPVSLTPEVKASMERHRIVEGWIDLVPQVYDRRMSKAQFVTALLNDAAVISDYSWWSHSVCAVSLVAESNGAISTRIWNSHDPNGNDHGDVILKGSKVWPDGAVAVRAVTLAA